MDGHPDQHAQPRGLRPGPKGLRPGPQGPGAWAAKRQFCAEKVQRLMKNLLEGAWRRVTDG